MRSHLFCDPFKGPDLDFGNHWTKLPNCIEIVKFPSASNNSNISRTADKN